MSVGVFRCMKEKANGRKGWIPNVPKIVIEVIARCFCADLSTKKMYYF